VPKTRSKIPVKVLDPPPRPPLEDVGTFPEKKPVMRLVSFLIPKAAGRDRPDSTFRVAKRDARKSAQRGPMEGEHRDQVPPSHPGHESSSGDGQEGLLILEALRRSFSSQASASPPVEAKPAPAGGS
jgi:hypothetical protein